MHNLLHISAHYGGGVGTVMSAWKNNDKLNNHRFTYLNKIEDNLGSGEIFNVSMIGESDIVVCHVWNHPSMFEFLINTVLPPCRLIIWSHVSGLYAPYVYFDKLIEYPDKFIFTSPVSYECKEIQNLPEYLKDKLDVIWSTYGIESFKNIQKVEHKDFNVGIVGTVDYGKLHPNFIDMCANVCVPDVKFIVCSSDSQEHLKARARMLNVYDKFSFEGRVESVTDYLIQYDVFGYPLQSTHYGSCEQALGEAMICGAVPVVLNNPAERYIVKHMKTGIVANTVDEYSKAIEYLYNNRKELGRMSDNAKIAAKKRYDIKNTIDKWNAIFNNLLKQEKKEHCWATGKQLSHFVYAVSLGTQGKLFLDYVFADYIGDNSSKVECARNIRDLYETNPMFASNKKGSIRQYLRYYPEDKYLQEWEKLLK